MWSDAIIDIYYLKYWNEMWLFLLLRAMLMGIDSPLLMLLDKTNPVERVPYSVTTNLINISLSAIKALSCIKDTIVNSSINISHISQQGWTHASTYTHKHIHTNISIIKQPAVHRVQHVNYHWAHLNEPPPNIQTPINCKHSVVMVVRDC